MAKELLTHKSDLSTSRGAKKKKKISCPPAPKAATMIIFNLEPLRTPSHASLHKHKELFPALTVGLLSLRKHRPFRVPLQAIRHIAFFLKKINKWGAGFETNPLFPVCDTHRACRKANTQAQQRSRYMGVGCFSEVWEGLFIFFKKKSIDILHLFIYFKKRHFNKEQHQDQKIPKGLNKKKKIPKGKQ